MILDKANSPILNSAQTAVTISVTEVMAHRTEPKPSNSRLNKRILMIPYFNSI